MVPFEDSRAHKIHSVFYLASGNMFYFVAIV